MPSLSLSLCVHIQLFIETELKFLLQKSTWTGTDFVEAKLQSYIVVNSNILVGIIFRGEIVSVWKMLYR